MGFLENDSIRQWDDEKQLEEIRRGEREREGITCCYLWIGNLRLRVKNSELSWAEWRRKSSQKKGKAKWSGHARKPSNPPHGKHDADTWVLLALDNSQICISSLVFKCVQLLILGDMGLILFWGWCRGEVIYVRFRMSIFDDCVTGWNR